MNRMNATMLGMLDKKNRSFSEDFIVKYKTEMCRN